MKIFLLAIGLVAWFTPTGRTEPIERDFGFGLTYFRIDPLAADLPLKPLHGSCVLDLRYVTEVPTSSLQLHAWLKDNASLRNPVFILFNARTSPVLLQQLAPRSDTPGVLTLGSVSAGFSPDITIAVSAEVEARAYAALSATPDIRTLIQATPSKIRRDEAAMLVAQSMGEPMTTEPETELTDELAAPAPNAPLMDLTLQRAVQIHRAWSFLHPPHP
ncbi:MAG: hypothetical protein K9M98_11420 [Cephaloticoccus sp.]|nr:hypothetical protein [Cephaloticoccus sp.]MCF7761100.1 hypothetical protein [Cephaloticoccus sp.]